MNKIPVSFPITMFDLASEKVSETLTKQRCRIFYKGENRNGSYISDEFAEKLIATLPYAPVKGIYDTDDFEDHGSKRSEGRIYGVVPEQFNFAWEKHLDDDGVEREYACADVYLFTALYEEATEVVGKGQSMEIYPPSIKGSWVDVDGKQLYKYTDGCFLGLQVLGDNAVPCFQGSSFFSLQEQQIYTLFTTLLEKIESIGGKTQVDNENMIFALSDNQKQNAIFRALNTERVRYYVFDTYEDYALVFDFEDEKYLKVGYTKNEDDSISVSDNFEEVVCEYVTAEEKAALDSLRSKTEVGTYEATSAAFDEKANKVVELQTEVDNKIGEISTLTTEKETLTSTIEELNGQVENYTAQVAELNSTISDLESFKSATLKAEKEAYIAKYSKKLNPEIIESFTAKIDEYTMLDLRKDLALALVENNEAIFTLEESGKPGYVPQEQEPSGLAALLNKYKK